MPANIIAIVQLPPPVTGLSAMNKQVVGRLDSVGAIYETINVSPPLGMNGARKHLGRLLRTLSAAICLLRARRSHADTLYMPCDGGLGLAYNVLLMAVARMMKYRVWLHHHSFAYVNRRSAMMQALIAISPTNVGHVVLCSTMLQGLARTYPKAWASRRCQGFILSNAFGVEAAEPEASRVADDAPPFTLGHLSNLTEQKGSLAFIGIFEALRDSGLDVRARMAGPIGDEPTRRGIEAAQLKHGAAFEWVGPVFDASKTAFLDSLDAFVFPSDYVNEAQPVVLFEALARGVPVLATARGCMACDHAHSPGLVVPFLDFRAAAIAWLTDSTEAKRTTLRQDALRTFAALKATSEAQMSALASNMSHPAL
jgi:glycosyltransferase involved in cell wall biosynthesis